MLDPPQPQYPRQLSPQGVWRYGRNLILHGATFLIPIAVTYLLFRLAFRFLDDLIGPIRTSLAQWLPGGHWLELVAPISTVVLLVLMLGVVGLIIQSGVGQRLISFGEDLVDHIPVLRAIYGPVREATDLLTGGGKRFSRVVLVGFPHPGAKSFGFVTGTFQAPDGQEYLMVFVPTTPHPMAGYLILFKEDEVEEAGISANAAFRIVLTGGLSETSVSNNLDRGLQMRDPLSK